MRDAHCLPSDYIRQYDIQSNNHKTRMKKSRKHRLLVTEQVSGVGSIKESIYLECVTSTLTEKTSQKTSFEETGEEKNWT